MANVKRRFIHVTEGQEGQTIRHPQIEVCVECGENAPMRGDNPDRVCKGCDDGRKGNWIVSHG